MVRRVNETEGFEDISEYYHEDVRRIIRVAFEHGIILTPNEAYKAWQDFSDTMAAGWMNLECESDGSLWYSLPEWARGQDESVS